MAYIWAYPTTPEGVSKISHCHIFPWSTSFSIHSRRTIILREFSGRIAFANHVSLRERTNKNVLWEMWKWWGGREWIYNEWMVILIAWVTVFKTSKTQTGHLLSISGVNFILFAWKTSHSGMQQKRLCGVLKIMATNLLFYLLIWTL